MSSRGVVLFHTASSAFAAEKRLVAAGVECRLVPTPREFSSDCGVAVRFEWDQRDEVLDVLAQADVETAGVRRLT